MPLKLRLVRDLNMHHRRHFNRLLLLQILLLLRRQGIAVLGGLDRPTGRKVVEGVFHPMEIMRGPTVQRAIS